MTKMSNRLLSVAVLLGVVCAVTGLQSAAGQEPDFKKLKEMYGTPGPEHKYLEPLHGKWDITTKMFMPGKKDPTVTKATAERKWVMDKMYLQESVSGEFNGEKFKGQGVTGFDRFKKKFFFTWIDNMATGIMYGEGEYDPKTKTFTYSYTEDSPFLGKGVKARDVLKIVSDNEQHFTFYRTMPKGTEFKMMEMTYTRQSKKAE
jgi:hypothetical protein